MIEKFNLGSEIKAFINIKGKEYINAKQEVNYFNSIQAWKIESVGNSNYQMSDTMSDSIANSTDLPF